MIRVAFSNRISSKYGHHYLLMFNLPFLLNLKTKFSFLVRIIWGFYVCFGFAFVSPDLRAPTWKDANGVSEPSPGEIQFVRGRVSYKIPPNSHKNRLSSWKLHKLSPHSATPIHAPQNKEKPHKKLKHKLFVGFIQNLIIQLHALYLSLALLLHSLE